MSDFYLPDALLPSHKIQSGGSDASGSSGGGSSGSSGGGGGSAACQLNATGELLLRLSPTPKALGALSRAWCARSMVVSFKLETDEALLMRKAQAAIDATRVHAVVANLLQTRHSEVRVLDRAGAVTLLRAEAGGGGAELERRLADALAEMHAGC